MLSYIKDRIKKVREKIKAIRYLAKGVEIVERKNKKGEIVGGDISIKLNKSEIKFTVEGDVIINSSRHLITRRKLSLDNCREEFVKEAIERYDKGPEEYNKFIERTILEIQLEESNIEKEEDKECCKKS